MSKKDKKNTLIVVSTPRTRSDMLDAFEQAMGSLEVWQREYMQNPVVLRARDRIRGTRNIFQSSINAKMCVGCEHRIHYPEKFPKDYPDSMILCCLCLGAYLWSMGYGEMNIWSILHTMYPVHFLERQWEMFGSRIYSNLRLQ